ncbi:MAG: hypothetical protein U1F11_10540 [Steroidobacteraceae bacterium]
MSGTQRAASLVLAWAMAGAAVASGINGINGGMPNRISMNVTVPKQTQGASFGEKVNAGLHATGGALASGANLMIECGTAACVVALPDGSGYRADLASMTLAPLDAAQGAAVRQGAAGAALVGGALPGGAIVSAAVSSVSSLGGGKAAAPRPPRTPPPDAVPRRGRSRASPATMAASTSPSRSWTATTR